MQKIVETSRPLSFVERGRAARRLARPIVPRLRFQVHLVGCIKGRRDLNIDTDGVGIAVGVIGIRAVLAL